MERIEPAATTAATTAWAWSLLARHQDVQRALAAAGLGAITTEILPAPPFYYAEDYHQQYLARPGSRPYCSAQPQGVLLDEQWAGCAFKLPARVWSHYDWSINHCVLRGDNSPISLKA